MKRLLVSTFPALLFFIAFPGLIFAQQVPRYDNPLNEEIALEARLELRARDLAVLKITVRDEVARKKRYETLIAEYKKDIAAYPYSKFPIVLKAYAGLADVFLEIGDLKHELDVWKEALRLQPGYAAASHNMGVVYFRLKQYSDATKAFESALRLMIVDAHYTYTWLGKVYAETKQYEKAEKAYLEAIKLKPEYADAHDGLGTAYSELNQPSQARASHLKAVSLDPQSSQFLLNLGYRYLSDGMKAEAEGVREKLETMDAQKAGELLAKINAAPAGTR